MALALLVGSWVTWAAGFRNDPLSTPSGGILLLVESREQTPFTVTDEVSAQVTAHLRETGFQGYSYLRLELDFDGDRRGLRWWVVTSGAWQADAEAPLDLFCSSGGWASRNGPVVSCVGDPVLGATSVRYRFGDRIGGLAGGEDVNRIVDLAGYDDGSSTLVTGVVRDSDRVIVFVPVRTLEPARVGAEEQWTLPPFGYLDPESGSGEAIRAVAGVGGPRARFADATTGTPLEGLTLTNLSLSVDTSLRGKDLSWSRPLTSLPGALQWTTEGGGLDFVEYAIQDAAAEVRQAVRGLIVGALLSAALSLVLSLLLREETLV